MEEINEFTQVGTVGDKEFRSGGRAGTPSSLAHATKVIITTMGTRYDINLHKFLSKYYFYLQKVTQSRSDF